MTEPGFPTAWCNGTWAGQARADAALFPGATIGGRAPADWAHGAPAA